MDKKFKAGDLVRHKCYGVGIIINRAYVVTSDQIKTHFGYQVQFSSGDISCWTTKSLNLLARST